LTSGSRDKNIINHDVRVKDNIISILNFHEKEVCALKWSNNCKLLASGGNDNQLFVWDVTNCHKPLYTLN